MKKTAAAKPPKRKTSRAQQLDREIASALAKPRSKQGAARKKPAGKRLVVEYDVTGLSKAEIGSLDLHAVAQSEDSDAYDVGHPGVEARSRVQRRGSRKLLVVDYDVTDLSEDEIGVLTGEALAQAEGADGGLWIDGVPTVTPYPSVPVTSKIV